MAEATKYDWEQAAKAIAVRDACVFAELGGLRDHAEALAEELESLRVVNPPEALRRYREDYPLEDLGPDA